MVGSFGTRHQDWGSLGTIMSHGTYITIALGHWISLYGASRAVVASVTLVVWLDVPLGGAVVAWLTGDALIG